MDKIININFKKSDFNKLKKIAAGKEMSLRGYTRRVLIKQVEEYDRERARQNEGLSA
jgi:hypothetical protein